MQKKPLVTDAEFEVIKGRRPETWGEQQSREYSELNLIGKFGFWAILIPTMAMISWLAKTGVGWLTYALGWS
jgi:hypothetical protein